MSFQDLVSESKNQFPDLQIKYKESSLFMKILGKILFFNPSFMTDYITTIGSTVYFPSESYVKVTPVSASIALLHELVHVYDAKKINKYLFYLLYLFPQTLILLVPILFFFSWKIGLILSLIFVLPIPAYFRMHFEKRAYITSLYALNKLSKKLNFDPDLNNQKNVFITQFKNSAYYYMWIFSNIEKDFDNSVKNITDNKHPFEDSVFDIIDKLIIKI